MRYFLFSLAIVLVAGAARAQDLNWRVYFFPAPTFWSQSSNSSSLLGSSTTATTLQFGVGLERLILRGFALGADEQGADAGSTQFSGGVAGFTSLLGAYHFRRHKAFEPFVDAGYAIYDRRTPVCGVGFNYWGGGHVGARVEVREYLPVNDPSGYSFLVTAFRFGLVLGF